MPTKHLLIRAAGIAAFALASIGLAPAVGAQDAPAPASSSADAATTLYAYLYPEVATAATKAKPEATPQRGQFDSDTTHPWTADELQSLQSNFKHDVPPNGADKPVAQDAPVATFKIRPDGSVGPVTLAQSPYRDTIVAASQTFHLDPNLAHYVIEAESHGNPNAKSPKGAGGLMQLMPGTAAELGVANRFDVVQNIYGGVSYLSQLLTYFGRTDLALAAYNAGPGAVQKYGGVPPYEETRNYVSEIMSHLSTAAPAPTTR